MKFIKGVVVGSLLTTGFMMMCTDTNTLGKNKWMKSGKKMIKKIGLM